MWRALLLRGGKRALCMIFENDLKNEERMLYCLPV